MSSIILPEEIKVEEGASVQFKCLSTADTFKTYWTLQNNTLPGSHIKIDGSVLKIGVVSKTDRGIYVCHTKTSGREHQATARLIVTGELFKPPSFIPYLEDYINDRCFNDSYIYVGYKIKLDETLWNSQVIAGYSLQFDVISTPGVHARFL